MPHNIMGTPAMSLPLAMHSSGVPIGVQIAAKPAADHLVLQLAAAARAGDALEGPRAAAACLEDVRSVVGQALWSRQLLGFGAVDQATTGAGPRIDAGQLTTWAEQPAPLYQNRTRVRLSFTFVAELRLLLVHPVWAPHPVTTKDTFDLVLRRARAADAGEIQHLLAETWLAAYSGIFGTEKANSLLQQFFSPRNVRLLTSHPPAGFIVAEHEGTVVGLVCAELLFAGTIRVHMLYVRPSWQRMGVGTVLLERLPEIFPSASRISLEVLHQNNDAMRFYEALNFQIARHVRNAQRTGVPAWIMKKAVVPTAPTWSALLSVKLRDLRRPWLLSR